MLAHIHQEKEALFKRGLLAEGKTKLIEVSPLGNLNICDVRQKNDMTAGNGARHDVILGKGALVNRMSVNLFELLKHHGIPTAYRRKRDETSFEAYRCTMIPFEIVVRNDADGSFCKRNPDVEKGTELELPIVELYYKTKDKRLDGIPIEEDDPLIFFPSPDCLELHHPARPFPSTLMRIQSYEMRALYEQKQRIENIALDVNIVLTKAYGRLGARLRDFKIECGWAMDGKQLLVADSFSADEMRLIYEGKRVDKQGYRDGDSVEQTLATYQLAAELTDRLE